MKYANDVDSYIDSNVDWKDSLFLLRELFRSTRLAETIKWGVPVYTLNNKNVAGFHAFKSYVAVWFYQGVFLSDPANKLVNAQEGVTKALRQWRFGSVKEIRESRELILSYLEEAARNQEQGRMMKPERRKVHEVPVELRNALLENRQLKMQFLMLTPAKKREYTEYISEAMKAETRLSRIEKVTPMILAGEGLNDRYRK
ncbi:MAG: hypothetical protein EHM46_07010 [Bacteroidetes bacterium]|nr:MAG: hypothetical protein EHM46_07010 [Bacteroidota bacterium]